MHVTCRSPVTDSDEEDSAESSTDEEEEAPQVGEDGWVTWMVWAWSFNVFFVLFIIIFRLIYFPSSTIKDKCIVGCVPCTKMFSITYTCHWIVWFCFLSFLESFIRHTEVVFASCLFSFKQTFYILAFLRMTIFEIFKKYNKKFR